MSNSRGFLGWSGPEVAVQASGGFVDGAAVGAGGEVLPAGVGDDEDHVGAVTRGGGFFGYGQGGVQDGAGRDAGEDTFRFEELAGAAQRVVGADRVAAGEDGLVVELGNEALVEVAQAVDEFAVAWFGG